MTMGYRMGGIDARGATLRIRLETPRPELQAIVGTMSGKAHIARGNMSITGTAIGTRWV